MNTLFDDMDVAFHSATTTIQARKLRTLESVAHQTDAFYGTLFRRAVERLAERHQPFTSEDVIAQVGTPHPGESNRNNGIGALMHVMARQGFIRKTGQMVPAKRHASKGRELRVWIGVVR